MDQWPPSSELNRRGSTRPPAPNGLEQFLAAISSSQRQSSSGRTFTVYKDTEHDGLFMFREEVSSGAGQGQNSGLVIRPDEQLVSLETLLTPSMNGTMPRRLSLPIRTRMAVTMVAATLQLHQTGWLKDLGKKGIFLSPDSITEGRLHAERPFLEHRASSQM